MRLSDAILATVLLLLLGGTLLVLRDGGEQLDGRPRVIDGDTLDLAGRRLRLEGLDAPELAQECERGGRSYPCGLAARDRLRRIADAAPLSCRTSRADRYGRSLVRCDAAGQDVGAAMVRDGWAVAFGAYRREEAEARRAGRGLWAGPFVVPQDWRRDHPRGAGP